MKAAIIEGYGNADQLKLVDQPMPELRENDVLIEVYATSINPVDWKIRGGHLQEMLQYEFPLILGFDVAGVVVETGSGVKRFQKGDKVFSRPDITRNGAYAEYIAVDESEVVKKPENLSYREAAAVPLAALTAWQSLFDFSGMKEGSKVLIHAGSGGVGHLAIQIAKHAGAHVATTCSTRNVDWVQRLGADEVIDYTRQNFDEVLQDYDIVFDTVGGEIQERSYSVLKKGGTLVSIVNTPDEEKAKSQGYRSGFVFVQSNGEQLGRIGNLLEQGILKPVIDEVIPLDEIHKALEKSEEGHVRGKIVIEVKKEAVNR